MARGPSVTLRHAVDQRCVRLVPLRALPRGDIDEGGAEGPLSLDERARADVACGVMRLGRVMREVDIRVLVRGASLEERGLQLPIVEPTEIGGGDVDRRVPVAEQVRNDLRDAD